jgi:hypothetical protein
MVDSVPFLNKSSTFSEFVLSKTGSIAFPFLNIRPDVRRVITSAEVRTVFRLPNTMCPFRSDLCVVLIRPASQFIAHCSAQKQKRRSFNYEAAS